jgi:hypothetical protein
LFEDRARAVKHGCAFLLLTWRGVAFLRGILAGRLVTPGVVCSIHQDCIKLLEITLSTRRESRKSSLERHMNALPLTADLLQKSFKSSYNPSDIQALVAYQGNK